MALYIYDKYLLTDLLTRCHVGNWRCVNRGERKRGMAQMDEKTWQTERERSVERNKEMLVCESRGTHERQTQQDHGRRNPC